MSRLGGSVVSTENAREFSSVSKGETLEGAGLPAAARRRPTPCAHALRERLLSCSAMPAAAVTARRLAEPLICRHDQDHPELQRLHCDAPLPGGFGQAGCRGRQQAHHQRRRWPRSAPHTGQPPLHGTLPALQQLRAGGRVLAPDGGLPGRPGLQQPAEAPTRRRRCWTCTPSCARWAGWTTSASASSGTWPTAGPPARWPS